MINSGYIYKYDIYTGNHVRDEAMQLRESINYEHVIPAFIMAKRVEGSADTEFYLNKEPYHDPHLVFPTIKKINDARENFAYGQFVDSRQQAIDNQHEIVNEEVATNVYDPLILYKLYNKRPEKDIYINRKAQVQISDKRRHCDFGRCVFQPPLTTRGAIARAIFYYYLMYGYEPSTRPYTFESPWLFHGKNYVNFKSRHNQQVVTRQTVNDDKWNIFFHDNKFLFRHWAQDHITRQEINSNLDIIKLTTVPNIFVSHLDNNGNMQLQGNSQIIDELFFGLPHDHNKYKFMSFYEYPIPNRQQIDYRTVMRNVYEMWVDGELRTPPHVVNIDMKHGILGGSKRYKLVKAT